MTTSHHIQRQRIELEAAVSAATAGRWHAQLEALHEHTLLPLIESELERVGEERTIVIDRLELSLEIDDPEQLEQRVGADFRLALRRALRPHLAEREAETAEDLFGALLHFLRTGTTGWRTADGRWLREGLLEAAERWEAEKWERFFTLFAEAPDVVFGRCTQVQSGFLALAWSRLLAQTDQRTTKSPSPSRDAGPDATPALRAWKAALAAKEKSAKKRHNGEKWQNGVELMSFAGAESYLPDDQDGYFVPNAGLVLLHPYLQYLADETSAVDATGVLDAHRMAAMLHFAVNGDAPFLEWEHTLTKLLLGKPLGEPLLAAPLTDEERAFVREFLAGIIAHWSALGDTGVDALRDAFLQRPGLLRREAGGWRLTVEPRAYDLLLAKLPWGVSLIKSPWMPDELLQVDWA